MLGEDCLLQVLSHLSLPALLLCAVPLSHLLAELAEVRLRGECLERGWRLTRRFASTPNGWRKMLRSRSCAVCLCPTAPFGVRKSGSGAVAFKLCRGCARRDTVQQQVGWHSLSIDSLGEQGQALFGRQFHTPLFGSAHGFSRRAIAQG